MTQDYNYIEVKGAIMAITNIFIILVQIMLMVYFVAQLLFVFIHFQEIGAENENEVTGYFLENEKWSLKFGDSNLDEIIMFYYSLTSLSTIGLGDFHPITSYERILCSFLFLIGVMLFSYALGQLQNTLENGEFIYRGEEDEK